MPQGKFHRLCCSQCHGHISTIFAQKKTRIILTKSANYTDRRPVWSPIFVGQQKVMAEIIQLYPNKLKIGEPRSFFPNQFLILKIGMGKRLLAVISAFAQKSTLSKLRQWPKPGQRRKKLTGSSSAVHHLRARGAPPFYAIVNNCHYHQPDIDRMLQRRKGPPSNLDPSSPNMNSQTYV